VAANSAAYEHMMWLLGLVLALVDTLRSA